MVFRSWIELNRLMRLGHTPNDILPKWMEWIKDCQTLYDLGSSNGLEGFYIHHLHGSKIVFIEPFTPSIESILKTICIVQKYEKNTNAFEVVHAAASETEGYQRLFMHAGPIPGSNNNSFMEPDAYCRGGRQHLPINTTQWVKSVSLDALHWTHGLPQPTHVKIDVDGFEARALQGCERLLKEGCVHSWAIEINDNLYSEIADLMQKHDYVEVEHMEHHPESSYYTADHIFVRRDLVETWPKN